jgi:hypothetical protein
MHAIMIQVFDVRRVYHLKMTHEQGRNIQQVKIKTPLILGSCVDRVIRIISIIFITLISVL